MRLSLCFLETMGSEANTDTSEILLIRFRGLYFINFVILLFGDTSRGTFLASYTMGGISVDYYFSKEFLVMVCLGDV
jgi:hypothetical protein